MKLEFIALDKLAVSKANMRYARKAPDVTDILPTVRKRGVIVPLLVRPQFNPDPDAGSDAPGYEIVAGARRFHAACIVAAEAGDGEPVACLLPCAILDDGDDAAAIEASLIENTARLDPDEVTQWEAFSRLVREGRKPEDIGATFGIPDAGVRRILALGNLLPRIRNLYRAEKIDAATIRHLTMASKQQQQDWIALFDDPQARAPTGQQLKAWLFGGTSIKASHALFDIDQSGLATVADLFGEDRYFASADGFWTAQNAAIEARHAAYLEAGWCEVVVVPATEHFHGWEHEKTPKNKGGRVYIDVRASGEVVFHEGYLSRREAERARRADQPQVEAAKPARAEMTAKLQAYVDLHRHSAVRAVLAGEGGVALRLMVAHAIAGTHLFRVEADPQSAPSDEIAASLAASRGEAVFAEKRGAVLALLGFDTDSARVIGGRFTEKLRGDRLAAIFLRLLDLPDPAVLDVVSVVMGEALACGSVAVEAVGMHLAINLADWWEADGAFLDLNRDREVLTAMVADTAGPAVASANAGGKTKALKAIVADCLAGDNGRTRIERWVPRWVAFPPAAYTARGGVGTVSAAAKVPPAPVPQLEPGAAQSASEETERLAA